MKLLNLIRRAPKQLYAVLAVATAVVAVPAALLAWGPDRPTYTVDNPADHVTFNSITNNPNIGDERNFVGIREAGTQNLWSDNMNVESGKTYTVRLFVHNNAATSLNASGAGIAHDVTAKVNLPTTTSKSIQVDGEIDASNASPNAVWDQATFTGAQDFNLAYVPGTLKYENNAGTFTLPESIFTNSGAKLGYDKMDGNLPGCFQYSGYVTFQVKPQFAKTADFTVNKMVSKHGANNWVKSYAAQPGETVDYLVEYKNTGEVQQDSVTVKDTLPTGVSYTAGTTVLGNSQNPSGIKTNDGIADKGLNIGSYAPNGPAWMTFSAKLPTVDQLPCGPQTLTNKVSVETDYGTKNDTADVTVTGKECVQPQPIEVCRLADKVYPVTIDEKDFDSTKYSKNPADCQQTPTPQDIQVCRLADKVYPVTIKESDFDSTLYSKNPADCQHPTTPVTVLPAEVPAELPHTGSGIADVVSKLAGAVSLVSAAAYYITSRRNG